MQLSDFNYELPAELIAQHPLANRTDSRLLEVKAERDDCVQLVDSQFKDILNLMRPGDLVVFNDTKVIPARLHGKKETGGNVELLIERISGDKQAWVQIRASKVPKTGSIVHIHNQAGETFPVEMIGYDGRFYEVRFPENVFALLERLVNYLFLHTSSINLMVKMRNAIKLLLRKIQAPLLHQPQVYILTSPFCSN